MSSAQQRKSVEKLLNELEKIRAENANKEINYEHPLTATQLIKCIKAIYEL